MFGMVNNGVHWASDYPLGIAMGYVFGKAATQLGRSYSEDPATTVKSNAKSDWMIMPAFKENAEGLTLISTF